MELRRYIELKSGGHCDSGPAWIAYVEQSKTGRTLWFNGRELMKFKGHRRGAGGSKYVDMDTGESFWISGVPYAVGQCSEYNCINQENYKSSEWLDSWQ